MPNEEQISSFDNISDVSKLIQSKRDETSFNSNGHVIGQEGAEKRDEKYTELLEKFLSNYSLEKALIIKQKKTFFDFILAFFSILLLSGIALLFLGLFINSQSSLAIVIGASVDILVSFIAIPTIIAKHLFPEKIDNDVIEVVKLLVGTDENVRKALERLLSGKN